MFFSLTFALGAWGLVGPDPGSLFRNTILHVALTWQGLSCWCQYTHSEPCEKEGSYRPHTLMWAWTHRAPAHSAKTPIVKLNAQRQRTFRLRSGVGQCETGGFLGAKTSYLLTVSNPNTGEREGRRQKKSKPFSLPVLALKKQPARRPHSIDLIEALCLGKTPRHTFRGWTAALFTCLCGIMCFLITHHPAEDLLVVSQKITVRFPFPQHLFNSGLSNTTSTSRAKVPHLSWPTLTPLCLSGKFLAWLLAKVRMLWTQTSMHIPLFCLCLSEKKPKLSEKRVWGLWAVLKKAAVHLPKEAESISMGCFRSQRNGMEEKEGLAVEPCLAMLWPESWHLRTWSILFLGVKCGRYIDGGGKTL